MPSAASELDLARHTLAQAFKLMSPELLKQALALGATPHWTVGLSNGNEPRPYFRAILTAFISSDPKSLDLARILLDELERLPRPPQKLGSSADLNSALFHSVSEGTGAPVEKTALLLSRGADPNAITGSCRTAAQYACWRESEHETSAPILRLLAEAGADLGAVDDEGCSAMDIAIDHGNLPAIAELWRLGQSPNELAWNRRFDAHDPAADHWPQAQALIQSLRENQALGECLPPGRSSRPARSGL